MVPVVEMADDRRIVGSSDRRLAAPHRVRRPARQARSAYRPPSPPDLRKRKTVLRAPVLCRGEQRADRPRHGRQPLEPMLSKALYLSVSRNASIIWELLPRP